MLVRRPKPIGKAAPPENRKSTAARARASSSARESNCRPCGVMRAPPPPEPPTVRSTSVCPLRLLSVSMACQAAL